MRHLKQTALIPCLLLILLLADTTYAQGITGFRNIVEDRIFETDRTFVRAEMGIIEVSTLKPYTSKDYFNGTISLANGEEVVGFFKYNVLEQRLEMRDTEVRYLWADVEKFEWDNRESGQREVWTNIKRIWPNAEFAGFGRQMSDQLIALYIMDYTAPTRDPRLDVGDINSYYVAELFHFAILDGKLMEVPRSKSDFFRIFGASQRAVIRFASKDNLRHDMSEDIAEIIDFHNRKNLF